MTDTAVTPAEKLSYEQAVEELEALVSRMEKGELPLEESIEAYRRGMALTRVCRQKLAKAEEEIRKLDEDGKLSEVKASDLRPDSAERTPEAPKAAPSSPFDDMPF